MAEFKQRDSGLRGMKVTDSSICSISDGLKFRGFPIEELVENSTFEETSYMIINGDLPTTQELQDWSQKLEKYHKIPDLVKMVMDHLPPDAHPMDVIRTGVSVYGIAYPEIKDNPKKTIVRVLGVLPTIIGYWYARARGQVFDRKEIQESTYAGYLLKMIKNDCSDTERIMMDKSLILYAEHELNASTFSARICAGTNADYYACLTNAICALSGPKHGGATEAVLNMISKYEDPNQAVMDIENKLDKSEKVPGFGHPVYLSEDPRTPLIKKWVLKNCKEKNKQLLFEIGEAITNVMATKCKDPCTFPNLDFYSALAYASTDIETILFTPIFAVSRSVGWSAHILEQRNINELFRPMANYIGPEVRKYIPIEDR